MCGICGFYSQKEFVTQSELNRMADSLNHRGPDAEGAYCNHVAGLAHKRLSILDLSENANQPMESHSRRYILVFNGEIYNYKEIAEELNLDFRTTSDTEVLLEAFEEWGVTFVNKLNGMFSIAIYDKHEKQLYLFRDRIGIKPLFYYWDGDHFAFASELKALLQVNYIKDNLEISRSAINEFLHVGYIPEPNTIYRKIKKFPAGHFGIADEEGLRIEAYWMIEGAIRRNLISNYTDAKNRLNELVESSVSSRLMSDVPFGSFLSGGIDSSLVTAVAQKHTKENLNTFSIGFKESKYNEAGFAKKVANYLGTNHHELIVSQDDAKEMIPELLNYYDEPFADSSAIPTMILSRFAREKVTMALSGDGGDELFHGYGSYVWAQRLSNPLIRGFRKTIGQGLSKTERYQHRAEIFNYENKDQLKSHIFSQEQFFFSIPEIENLITGKASDEINMLEDYSFFVRDLTAREDQAIFDLRYYLKDDLLTKLDRASMRYGLEARVPLLDHRIVEFALNLSPKLKVNQKVKKYLLKEVLYDYVPASYFDRPKWGFSIPLREWLSTDLKYLIDTYLSKAMIEKHGVVHYEAVESLKNKFLQGTDYLYNRIWVLIVLHQFLEKNKG
ncbi:MAG: asparagine synthase (glutamine-hydrolyzing) [Bacteroidales bacterium]|jgi:asparagine synthase (glutamine-hydrolysing)|nr:asparagine synthase (glutamine-hydrolyzing) [Bacteroidales bacterium]